MAQYGIPYMGSKQSIADKIISVFPKAENFYDLFGGGFSITHAMLLNRAKDFKAFYFNEIKSDIVYLIKRAVNGDFSYDKFKPPFISRDEFFKKLDDPYIRVCWSFGNNQKTYLFSKEIEPYKKSMHNAIVFNEFDELARKVFNHSSFRDGYSIRDKRISLRNRIEFFSLNGVPDFLRCFLKPQQLERLQQLEMLQQLERLERLEQLQRLERLLQLLQLQRLPKFSKVNFSSVSYEKVKIKPNSVIYCDIPYKGTQDYGQDFNREKFFDWCLTQTCPVFVSEYSIEDPRFEQVRLIYKTARFSNSKETKKNMPERIYRCLNG